MAPFPAFFNLTFEDFSGLRGLVFLVYPAGVPSATLSLIKSISSTNMQKIVLVPCFEGHGWRPGFWSSKLDTKLSDPVDRLRASGYRNTLELESQLEPRFAAAPC